MKKSQNSKISNKRFSNKLLMGISAFGLSLSFAASIVMFNYDISYAQSNTAKLAEEKTAGMKNDTYRYLNLFGDVFERVRAEYVEEVSDKELIEHALKGMLFNLDPHSQYMTEEEYKGIQIQTRGEFGGLGIEVTMENGLVKVVSPIDDTPAYRAGMKAGDLIAEIDGEQVMGMSLSEAVKKMRGKVGTDIVLTVIREGETEPLTVKITRAVIQLRPVKYRIENGNVGYIRVTTFNQKTFRELKKAIKEIKKEAGKDLVGYVLDLRNNPGGLLNQAIAVADAFLDKGEIVSTRGRSKDNVRRDNATPGDLTAGLPIVVLINGGSASASEIVAGALQDHKRGIVMGTKSFGKGSVQTILSLMGHGAMRLTTARYYTPSGRSIQAKGITPDIIVDHVAVTEYKAGDYVREADLKGALDSKKKKDKKSKLLDKTSKKTKVEDYQLSRAVDLLKGISMFNKTVEK